MAWHSWFPKILDMSLTGSVVICVVLLLRLILKRAPRVFSYALWAVVLFRLLCPVTLTAPVGVLRETEAVRGSYTLAEQPIAFTDAAEAAYRAAGDAANGGLGVQRIPTTQPERSASGEVYVNSSWWEVWVLFGQYVWLAGAGVMLLCAAVQYVRLRRGLVGAVAVQDNILQADHLDTPFVLGVLRPKIYLPSSLAESERDYVIAHERQHIRRGDPLWRLLAYAALCLYWFDPLVWLAFVLSRKDMEVSCDEAVMRKMGGDIRAAYSESLLRFATGKKQIVSMPLAFGEGDTKERIVHVMKYKKPALWVSVIAAVLCLGAVTVFAFNAQQTNVKNPAVRDYVPGDGYSIGDVDTQRFEQRSADFAIGAGKDGMAVFKDPERAWATFTTRYASAIWSVQRANYLPPLTRRTMDMYKTLGWQTDDPVEDTAFVSSFLDIYENSFEVRKSEGYLPDPTKESPLTAQEALESLERSVEWWEGDVGVRYVGFRLPASYEADENWSIQIAGRMVADDGMGMSMHYFEGEQWRAGKSYAIELTGLTELIMTAWLPGEDGSAWEREIDLLTGAGLSESVGGAYSTPNAAWEADLDGDGTAERIVLDVGLLEANAFSVPWVESADGTKLCELAGVGSPHSTWNTYALTELNGRTYLLEYRPSMATGIADYSYSLYALDGDRLELIEMRGVQFPTYEPMSDEEIDALIALVDRTNELWSRSRLLFTTDETVARGLVQPDGRQFVTGVPVICGKNGGPSYVESLSWISDELIEVGLYQEDMSLRDKLGTYQAYAAQRYEQYLNGNNG